MPAQKQPFKVTSVFRKIGKAIEPFPKAAMFQLAEEGFVSPFEQLIACLISVRTRDETKVPTAKRLFSVAKIPADIAKLSVMRIEELIHGTSFQKVKAAHIRDIAARTIQNYGGTMPCDEVALRSFTGVGPKCAHLVLGIACGDTCDQCGYPRPSSDESMGNCFRTDTGADHALPRGEIAQKVLDRDQSLARSIR